MTPAQLRQLGFLLMIAIALGLIAWRIWQREEMRFSAWEDAVFKRTPDGWIFNSPYPRVKAVAVQAEDLRSHFVGWSLSFLAAHCDAAGFGGCRRAQTRRGPP